MAKSSWNKKIKYKGRSYVIVQIAPGHVTLLRPLHKNTLTTQ